MKLREVYLDNAATTPINESVKEVMLPFLEDEFGNPSSFHIKGKRANDAIEVARETVASLLDARADEIIFTSGGTESDNLAILGIARKYQDKGKHIVTLASEHKAVLESIDHLVRKEGFEVTFVEIDKEGLVDPKKVIEAIRPDTILVSIMYANNEIGAVQPIQKIGKEIIKYKKENKTQLPFFHTDACQATGSLPMNIPALHVDAMTINASKIYGPKGIGALYLRRGIKVEPLQFGGTQEGRKRPGTQNVAGIIGFAKAVDIAIGNKEKNSKHLKELSDILIDGIIKNIPKTKLNGSREHRLPNNVNISFMDIEGEALLLYLDANGVYASTGSACTSATLDPSHVILALGYPYEVAHGSIRFSLGISTTKEDIEYVLEVLPPLVEKLRKISPVSVDKKYFE